MATKVDRSLYLFGDVSDKTAEEVIASFHAKEFDTIFLHTNGGDLMAALSIYDAIVGKGVTVIGTGHVASCGTVILLAGDKRLGTEHTRFMTHGVQIQSEGTDPKEWMDTERKLYEGMLVEMFTTRGKVTAEKAEKMLASPYIFWIDEAIENGFIHGKWSE